MKAAEPKPAASASNKNANFFSKGGEQNFFGSIRNENTFFQGSKTSNSVIQPKLTIGQPNDLYEKEADAMADKVIQRLATPDVSTKKENTVQAKPIVPAITPLVQSKTVTPAVTNQVQKKCSSCESEEKLQKKEDKDDGDLLKDKLQKKPIFDSNAQPPSTNNSFSFGNDNRYVQRKCAACEEEDKVQKKSDSSPQTASPNFESSLSSSKGSGSPLPDNTRSQMESSFGADFSGVKIHTNNTAVQMSKDLNAQAFTHGSDVYFNSGKYDTNSSSGKHLLAHELTHVVQQGKNVKSKRIQRFPSFDIESLGVFDFSARLEQFKNELNNKLPAFRPIPDGLIEFKTAFSQLLEIDYQQ